MPLDICAISSLSTKRLTLCSCCSNNIVTSQTCQSVMSHWSALTAAHSLAWWQWSCNNVVLILSRTKYLIVSTVLLMPIPRTRCMYTCFTVCCVLYHYYYFYFLNPEQSPRCFKYSRNTKMAEMTVNPVDPWKKPSCRRTALNRCTQTESRWNEKNLCDRHQNMLWCACQVRTRCREQSHWEDHASEWL